MYITHFSAPLTVYLISFCMNGVCCVVKDLEDIVYLFPNVFVVEHYQSVLPKYENENCPPSAPKLYA